MQCIVGEVLVCCRCPWSCPDLQQAPQQHLFARHTPVALADGQLTDLASFYTLPSSVIGHDRHTEMRAAFHYYTVSCCRQMHRALP